MTVEAVRSSRSTHRDRVSQVYFGMLNWGTVGAILRGRIDWMVEQARGPRILDVGCSEGVVEILLSRKGFHVTGVDIDAEGLAFAQDLLAREPEDVRARVRFVHGDLAQDRLLEEQFDTLVMGELLEHLEDPKLLLDRSLDLVRPDGRVIVTTPFGYHPHEDHRQTFCLSNFMTLVRPRCVVEHLQVEGGYIRMVGRVSGSAGKSERRLNGKQLLRMTETALVSSQQRLHRTIGHQESRIGLLERRAEQNEGRATKLQDCIQKEKRKTVKLRHVLERGKKRELHIRKELEKKRGEAATLQREVEAAQVRATALQKTVDEGRSTAAALQRVVEEVRVEAASLQQQVREGQARATALQQELEEGKATAVALQQEVDERQAEAAALRQRVGEGEVEAAQLQKALKRERAAANQRQVDLNEARETETAIRRSIRWQLGTLLVDAVRQPWRVHRLPFDLTRLSLVALGRRGRGAADRVPEPKRVHRSAATNTLGEHAGSTAAGAGCRSKLKPTATPSTRSPSLEQTVDWIVDQVEGQHVTVVGCDNGSLIESLDRLRFNVTRGDFKSSFSEPPLAQREQLCTSRCETEKTLSAGGYSGREDGTKKASEKGDTAIVWGMSRAGVDAAGLLNCVRDRWARPDAKVIVVEPRFQLFSQDGGESGLTPLLTALRTTTVPESLSLAGDGFRFAGRLGRPSPEAWTQFEAAVWPEAMRDVVKSLRSRQQRQVNALEQRVQDVLQSTSYRAGQVLVRSAQEPRILWKAPLGLWRLYRSAAARQRSRQATLPSSSIAPVVSIPALNPPSPRNNGTPTVAAILDTFTESCLRYEADLVLLSPKHWKSQLERAKPAFLLVESAWAGNDGAWRYLLSNYRKRDVNPVRELVKYCRERRIATVFWNKEDPPNFDVFIAAAKDFDFIFTTDEDCITEYRKVCGHDQNLFDAVCVSAAPP